MITLKQPKYATLGYLWSNVSITVQRMWMQFADDALVIASKDKNAQILRNVFDAWCRWARMLIRIDKCTSFGMRKRNSQFSQYLPLVSVDGRVIPQVAPNHDFTYLGKYFNFNMNKNQAKTDLKVKLIPLLEKIKNLHISPLLKKKY